MLVVGIVVGIQDYEKRTLYTSELNRLLSSALVVDMDGYVVDDSTAVIDCVLRHPSPPKIQSTWSGLGPRLSASSNGSPFPPPPTPITAIGYPVQVIGKVVRFHESRQIIAESIGR